MSDGGGRPARSAAVAERRSDRESSAGSLEDLLQQGYRYALALTHDPAAAEDLVQDAWLAILRGGHPRHPGYLLTTIRNRFIDQDRRRRLLILESLDDEESPAGRAGDRAPVHPEGRQLDRATLERALRSLHSAEREALILSVVEGYSQRQVSEMTGQPLGTVASLVRRSRAKLRRFFDSAGTAKRRQP